MIEQHSGEVRYLQFSHYLQFPALVHGAFMRTGGCSEAPYASLNTSTPPPHMRLGDSIENVVYNRVLTLQALNIQHYPCATLWQVHGAEVAVYNGEAAWRTDWSSHSYYEQRWRPESIRRADALISRQPGTAIALSFADCVPITFYDPVEQAIGIAHGGWRGTARGVAMSTVDAMCKFFGSQPQNIYAGIGPSIGPCCYEISEEVRYVFMGQAQFEEMPTAIRYRQLVRKSAVFSTQQLADTTNLRLDLRETNRQQLLMAGVLAEHIETLDICTSCHKDRFFSHRGDQGQTGRFPVIMALKA